MCKECGCGETNGNTRLQFTVKGYTEESAKEVEKALLGLPGVLFVHIHAHDGETTVDYSPAKTISWTSSVSCRHVISKPRYNRPVI